MGDMGGIRRILSTFYSNPQGPPLTVQTPGAQRLCFVYFPFTPNINHFDHRVWHMLINVQQISGGIKTGISYLSLLYLSSKKKITQNCQIVSPLKFKESRAAFLTLGDPGHGAILLLSFKERSLEYISRNSIDTWLPSANHVSRKFSSRPAV